MPNPTITVTSNAPQVGMYFAATAARSRVLFGAAAMAVIAKEVRRIVDPILAEETPKDKGDLAKSQQASTRMVPGGAEITWTSDEPYADYVLHGTGVYHTPDAHSEWDVYGMQAFMVNGQLVVTQHTHHYGQHPNDYPDRAIERAAPAIIASVRAMTGAAIVELFRA